MRQKTRVGIGVIVFVFALIQSGKADSFDFVFQGATDSGSGVFTTSPLLNSGECSPASGGCYAIQSITGKFDGNDISATLLLTDYYGLLSTSLDLVPVGAGVGFRVGSEMWGLSPNPSGPSPNVTLFGIAALYPYSSRSYDFSTNGIFEPVTLKVTPAPEPATWLALALGLLGLSLLKGFSFERIFRHMPLRRKSSRRYRSRSGETLFG